MLREYQCNQALAYLRQCFAAYCTSRTNSTLSSLLAIYLEGPELCADFVRWGAKDVRRLYQPGCADDDNGEEEMQIIWRAFKGIPQSYLVEDGCSPPLRERRGTGRRTSRSRGAIPALLWAGDGRRALSLCLRAFCSFNRIPMTIFVPQTLLR